MPVSRNSFAAANSVASSRVEEMVEVAAEVAVDKAMVLEEGRGRVWRCTKDSASGKARRVQKMTPRMSEELEE